jgi:ubiquinone/menaquinone biosynthesis C-methylase UbiE
MPSFISFIPTPFEEIEGFFELTTLSLSDVVYDLGSGDGRLLFGALDKGAGKAIGIDIDPQRVREATEAARSKGLDDKATFLEADVMEVSLDDASVILCYLSHSASAALKPKLESELKPGTRVIMESFPVPGWKPVRTAERGYKHFYLYIMPPELSDEYTTSYADYNLYYY